MCFSIGTSFGKRDLSPPRADAFWSVHFILGSRSDQGSIVSLFAADLRSNLDPVFLRKSRIFRS